MLTRRRPIFIPGALLVLALFISVLCALFAGCASNPFSSAQSIDQKAYAVYGTFVIVEEQGAKLVNDSNTPVAVRQAIVVADLKAKPTADTLVAMLHQYETAKAAVSAGTSSADKLSVATANLNDWIRQATTDVNNLVTAVKATK